MMPVVRISDSVFSDLKLISKWYETDTPSETIDVVVREMMERLGLERHTEPAEMPTVPGTSTLKFDVAPGLTFTKPLAASVNGKALQNPNWAGILLAVIAQVKEKGLSAEKLAGELLVPATPEMREEDGFRYYSSLGISVQGQSASDAWKETDRLAKKWRIPVVVEFQWRQNPRAQHPGRIGQLHSGTS